MTDLERFLDKSGPRLAVFDVDCKETAVLAHWWKDSVDKLGCGESCLWERFALSQTIHRPGFLLPKDGLGWMVPSLCELPKMVTVSHRERSWRMFEEGNEMKSPHLTRSIALPLAPSPAFRAWTTTFILHSGYGIACVGIGLMLSRGDMGFPEKGEVNDTLGFCRGTSDEAHLIWGWSRR